MRRSCAAAAPSSSTRVSATETTREDTLHPTAAATSPAASYRTSSKRHRPSFTSHLLLLALAILLNLSLSLGPPLLLPVNAQTPVASLPSTPPPSAPPPPVTSIEIVIPSPPVAEPTPSLPTTAYQGITTFKDYPSSSPNCTGTLHTYRVSLITHALALTGFDPKMDAKNSMPLAITDEMSGLEYDPHRMSAAIYSAIQYPVDALVVSIPDIDVLREPLLAARKKNIPVIAVYSGLQAAKDLDILAIMSDDVSNRTSA
ncbi:MAG: hypothetical protein J3R72DRAFT_164690 [Linnemannia gamsii]|nr:MAG: hypothetical protein J3R72DRAFT_164690 [Linnemannia gamsii]